VGHGGGGGPDRRRREGPVVGAPVPPAPHAGRCFSFHRLQGWPGPGRTTREPKGRQIFAGAHRPVRRRDDVRDVRRVHSPAGRPAPGCLTNLRTCQARPDRTECARSVAWSSGLKYRVRRRALEKRDCWLEKELHSHSSHISRIFSMFAADDWRRGQCNCARSRPNREEKKTIS